MEPALRTHADKNRQYGGYFQICLEQCLKLKKYVQVVQKAHFIYNNASSPTTTSFPGSLILPPRVSEERPCLEFIGLRGFGCRLHVAMLCYVNSQSLTPL